MSEPSGAWGQNDTPVAQPQADATGAWGAHDTPAVEDVANKTQGTPPSDGGNIITRTLDRIKGKQDPAYADVPAFHELPWSPEVERADAVASLSGAGQDARANIIQHALGDQFVNRFKDANGYDVFEYKDGLTGQTKRFYPSKPGLDRGDIERGVLGAVPYVGAGKLVGWGLKGAPAVVNALGQAGAAGAANAGSQLTRIANGSGEDMNGKEVLGATAFGGIAQAVPSKVLAPAAGALYGLYDAASNPSATNTDAATETALGGAAGFAAAALARRMLGMAPGLYAQNGRLTARGEDVARAANIDPAELQGAIADEFAKTYAATRDAAKAALATETRSGIDMTKGQRLKDPMQLAREDQMRWGIRGEDAKAEISNFDAKQAQQVKDAAYGGIYSPPQANGGAPVPIRQGVGKTINPALGEADKVPVQDLGSNVQAGLQAAREGGRAAENAAWEKVPSLQPTDDGLAALPQIMEQARSGRIPDPVVTPVSHRMSELLQTFYEGKSQEAPFGVLGKSEAAPDINTIRIRLGQMVGGAQSDADRTLAGKLYEGFNDWIDYAANQKLLQGDPNGAAAMVAARGISRDVKGLFSPQAYGQKLPAGNIIEKAMSTDSPEGVIQTLVGSPTGQVRNGSVMALKNIKQALDTYAPDKAAAAQTWNDLRLAHWNKIVQDQTGNLSSPTVIATSIEKAFSNQKSVLDTLYSPAEQRLMLQLARECRGISWRPVARTNPSGSGMMIGVMGKELLSKLWEAFGLGSRAGQFIGAAMSKNPVTKFATDAWQKSAAKAATDQSMPEVLPTVGPYGSALYGATRNDLGDSR